ncbi:MAG: hypothetical protein O3B64_03900 [bacterium]|nr:hypothetical protein [bacterium]
MNESFLHRQLELHAYHVVFAILILLVTFFLVLMLPPARDSDRESHLEVEPFSEITISV